MEWINETDWVVIAQERDGVWQPAKVGIKEAITLASATLENGLEVKCSNFSNIEASVNRDKNGELNLIAPHQVEQRQSPSWRNFLR